MSGDTNQDQAPKQLQIIENYLESFVSSYTEADQKTMMSNSSNKDEKVRRILVETLSKIHQQ